MSSEPEDQNNPQKKRRLQNACDLCRRRKVKCNSAEMPDNVCSGCLAANAECMHAMPLRKRGPKPGTVGPLEKRVMQLEEKLLQASAPSSSSAGGNRSSSGSISPPANNEDYLRVIASDSSSDASRLPSLSPIASASAVIREAEDETGLADSIANMNLGRMMQDGRFFGPSSSFHYLQDAVEAKTEYIKSENLPNSELPSSRRPEFWVQPTHELLTALRSIPTYHYPPEDLMESLFNIFFRDLRHELPFIHEQNFRREFADGLHLRDHYFGGTVLLICAVASRISEDPRVFIPGAPGSACGWQWFEQVQLVRKVIYEAPTLYELQAYCLALAYALGTSSPGMVAHVTSMGLRFCQELGVHRKRPSNYKRTIDDELKRRCFWFFVSFDRWTSSFVGRPTGYREEDYDAELPVECDDEYMTEDAEGVAQFRQPSHIPSMMVYLKYHVKLLDILSLALRALYSTEKSRIQIGLVGENWQTEVVTQLDSSLNEWQNTLPPILLYDPKEPDPYRFARASNLYICHRVVQIQIHRPLMSRAGPMMRSSSSIICVGAARACASVLELQMQRNTPPVSVSLIACFMSAVTLLMHIWGNKQGGIVTNLQRDLADVEKCKAYFKKAEGRWHNAGRFRDMLNDLSLVKDIPLPVVQRMAKKRDRDEFPVPTTTSSLNNIGPLENINTQPAAQGWDFPQTSYAVPLDAGVRDDWQDLPQSLNAETYGDPLTATQDFHSFAGTYPPPLAEDDINNMFWQAPTDFNMREWHQYIAKTTDELQRHQPFGM